MSPVATQIKAFDQLQSRSAELALATDKCRTADGFNPDSPLKGCRRYLNLNHLATSGNDDLSPVQKAELG